MSDLGLPAFALLILETLECKAGEGEPGCCLLKVNNQTTPWTSSSKALGKPCVLTAEKVDSTSSFQEGAGFLVTIPGRQCYGNNEISLVSKIALFP